MNAPRLIDSMHASSDTLRVIVAGVSAEDARFKPPSGAWSILEIVTHLADEEVEDFRTRVKLTLEDSSGANEWPPIDPPQWAIDRRYNEGDLGEALDRFLRERATSIDWLRGLNEPDWSKAYEHPKIGPIRAGDLLASWAAHDMLHLRQIAKRKFELIQQAGGEFTTDYAGPWGA